MNYEFVDKNINIFNGKIAKEKIKNKNDKKFLENNTIKKVSFDRWKEAQEYEKETWCFSNAKYLNTDRNEEHMSNFGGNYSQLNFHLSSDKLKIIELGCGPFTNLRLIIPQLLKPIYKIDLLDPLINDYILYTKNCSYKNNYLLGHKVNLYNSSIEESNINEQYDIIVMINVLEHCQNIDIIFDKIKSMMHKNSLFIFHDRSFPDNKIQEILNKKWDAGHPIVISDSYFENLIKDFKPIYKRNFYIETEERTSHYYIFKK